GTTEAVRPMVLGPAGARTAVISLLDRHQREPRSAAAIGIARDPAALASIRQAAAQHDAVIVVLHFVAELRERPLRGWRRLVSKILDAGADVVISHGTHVVGPVITERRAGRPVLVAWGLGNLLTEMGNDASPRAPDARDDKWASARSREQLLARIEVRPRDGAPPGPGVVGTRARIEVSFLPAWMAHDRDLVERHVIRGPIRHSIEPVAACGRPIPLPDTWPERERASVDRWVSRRRDHMLRASRLRSARCDACGADEACRRASGPHLLAAPHLAE
ncbi:MAG: CapA family protein, partial [Deltaproteobacteria bacterium]|nr:CapA family protein [Deltaproteobacteria bacterium]